MNLVKLGKKGQVSLPQAVLRGLGLAPDTPLLVEATSDGAILLRQVSIHPVEIYSDERLEEFAREDTLSGDALARHAALIKRFNRTLGRRAESAAAPAAAAPPSDAEPLPRPKRKPAAGRQR